MTDYSIPVGNYLRPNGHGGYLIRQSDLSSWSRCQMQKFYYDAAREDVSAVQPEALSATIFGTVVHHILMNMELRLHNEEENVLQDSLRSFEHYWDPENISAIPGAMWPTVWIAKQTYMGLKDRGRRLLKAAYDMLVADKSFKLGLEYQFAVPLQVNGRTHTLTGTIDRLAVRLHSNRRPYLALDDYKTGRKPTYLRWNTQGTAYAYATTQPEFWAGWPQSGMGALETFDEETIDRLEHLFSSHGYAFHHGSPAHREQGLPLASRRFRWVDLMDLKFSDGGWRVEQDYDRLRVAVDAYVRACEAEIYSVNLEASVCQWCAFKETCAGVGLPEPNEGAPV